MSRNICPWFFHDSSPVGLIRVASADLQIQRSSLLLLLLSGCMRPLLQSGQTMLLNPVPNSVASLHLKNVFREFLTLVANQSISPARNVFVCNLLKPKIRLTYFQTKKFLPRARAVYTLIRQQLPPEIVSSNTWTMSSLSFVGHFIEKENQNLERISQLPILQPN